MVLVQIFLSAFLFISVGLTISAGIGLLIWSPLYKLIYESFLIKDPNSTIKRIWNLFLSCIWRGTFLLSLLLANKKIQTMDCKACISAVLNRFYLYWNSSCYSGFSFY